MGHPRALGTLFDCTGLLKHVCCFNRVPGTGGLGNSLHFSLESPGSPEAELPGVTAGRRRPMPACCSP